MYPVSNFSQVNKYKRLLCLDSFQVGFVIGDNASNVNAAFEDCREADSPEVFQIFELSDDEDAEIHSEDEWEDFNEFFEDSDETTYDEQSETLAKF